MIVYVLTDTLFGKVLGVFSTIEEATKNYQRQMYTKLRLEEFEIDSTIGKECKVKNTESKTEDCVRRDVYEHFEPFEPKEIEECENCGGEDCIKNGECCNDNFSY